MNKKNLHFSDLEPKNIIVKMPNWLGDLVMSTPVLQDLKTHFPKSKLTALCLTQVAPLLVGNPFLDEILTYQKPSGWIHRAIHKDVIIPLRIGEYDLGILLTNSFSSTWWFWRGRVKERVGFSGSFRYPFLTLPVPKPPQIESQHLVLTYKELLKPLGIPLSKTPPALYLTSQDKKYIDEFRSLYHLRPNSVLLGINPGAAYGSAKCWLPERFEEVSRRIVEEVGATILYFGDLNTTPLIHKICKNLGESVINMAGKTTLRELMALISICNAFLTNDSGPMHIASALGIPIVALFGSTNEVKTGPYGGGRVIHKHVECSPCYKRVCPIDFRCMRNISAEEVYQQLHQILIPEVKS